MTIEFTIPGEAVPFARTAGGKTTPRFTPAKQRNYMGAIKMFAARAMQGRPPLEGPVELSVMAVYLWPKSWSAKKRAGAYWKTSKPDADNITKLVKDSLNTVAFADDAQVASSHAWKTYGNVARLTVKIVPLEACA